VFTVRTLPTADASLAAALERSRLGIAIAVTINAALMSKPPLALANRGFRAIQAGDRGLAMSRKLRHKVGHLLRKMSHRRAASIDPMRALRME
jgi:hypothetical protein